MVVQFSIGFFHIISQILRTSSTEISVEKIPLVFSHRSQISSKCVNQLTLFGQGFNNSEEWAIRMIDATAKLQSGVLFGNIMHVGNYDECLEIGKTIGDGNVRGKYCSAIFEPHPQYGNELVPFFKEIQADNNQVDGKLSIDAKISYGFCVPKDCSVDDLQILADDLEEIFHSALHFKFVEAFCVSDDGTPLTPAAVFGAFIFAVFALIIACCTLYDILHLQKHETRHPNIWIAFSLYTNGKKLLAPDTAEGTLSCLNGIRVISMMWIVEGHRFMYQFFVPQVNAAYIHEWRNSTENAFTAASAMAVDTFFVVSGLLVVYLFMKNQDKNIGFSLPKFYLHRIIRLTPSLMMTVLFTATLVKYMGSGPFWPVVDELFQKSCERNWWSTLIYLQNYIHTQDQCIGQAWYLAVDTQMYFISPLIFLPMIKWPRQTFLVICIFVVLNCVYVFEITRRNHLATLFFEQDTYQFAEVYSPTHVRGTVYIIGMVCGYFAYKTRKNRPCLNKLKVVGLWSISFLVLLFIVMIHSYFTRYNTTAVENALFNSLVRVFWAAALSVIILLCINGYGGPINDFLSCRIFLFLIRINYSVYLLHLLVMVSVVAQQRTPGHLSNLSVFHVFWGDYIFTVGASVLWTLAFELPILVIEKIIFGTPKRTPVIPK